MPNKNKLVKLMNGKNVTISEIPKPEPAGGLFFFYYFIFMTPADWI